MRIHNLQAAAAVYGVSAARSRSDQYDLGNKLLTSEVKERKEREAEEAKGDAKEGKKGKGKNEMAKGDAAE